jgi:uncharacterized coiled-coil protein SlyX
MNLFQSKLKIKDEFNKDLIERDNNILDNIIKSFNEVVIPDSNDYAKQIETLRDIKERIKELNKSTKAITVGDLILAFIVRQDESKTITEIKLIEKLRVGICSNQLELNKSEIDMLTSKIEKSSMLSMFKAQCLDYLNDYLITVLQTK